MPNLQQELDHLRMADAHITTAERALADMHAALERQRAEGGDTTAAEVAYQAMLDGIEAFRRHRALIVQNIEGIKNGTL